MFTSHYSMNQLRARSICLTSEGDTIGSCYARMRNGWKRLYWKKYFRFILYKNAFNKYVFDILRVQIRSVQKCIYFKTKWMNRSINYPSLPTFSHLSGNFRIPSRKNDSSLEAIQFWSQFSISVKEVNRWLAAYFGTTSNQKEQCPENTAGAVKHPIWAFPNIGSTNKFPPFFIKN